jgi:cyclic-di-AMP phosphodiesterase PgpH
VEKSRIFFRYAIIIVFIGVLFYSIPKEGKFKFEYKKYEIWQHEDLVAPYSFAIKKSPEDIEKEKIQIRKNFKPFFKKNAEFLNQKKQEFINSIQDYVINYEKLDPIDKKYLSDRGKEIISDIYNKGIIENTKAINENTETIKLISGNISEEIHIHSLYRPADIEKILVKEFTADTFLQGNILFENFARLFTPDILYYEELSEKKLNSDLEEISPSAGMIEKGEKIIAKGNVITPEKYQILESLKTKYELKLVSGTNNYLMYLGYFLLIILITYAFFVYIKQFYSFIFNDLKKLILIFSLILGFMLISIYVSSKSGLNIYIIPFCVIPILLISFFDARIAFISHLITILLASMIAPNRFEFLFIQIMAGLSVILGISRVRYLSHFFLTTLFLLIVYYLSYLGLKLIQVKSFHEVEVINFLWFTGNFVLTLLAYPLIYAFEKIFSLLSDMTLIELSDINRKLLRDLSAKAPGTFQHSLQVANLTESVLNEIGGNALLARVGALYHDIGKIDDPIFYTENQNDTDKPHANLSYKESSQIIISHISKGIEIAKKYRLPDEIVDFIRTHHGTSRTEFFYRSYQKEHPGEIVDDTVFRYPGPKPQSRENAVVMIVDTVEAASRSIKEPTEKILDELIESLVDQKYKDHQLDDAKITNREINIAKEILKKKLKSIYHARISYPAEKKEPLNSNGTHS